VVLLLVVLLLVVVKKKNQTRVKMLTAESMVPVIVGRACASLGPTQGTTARTSTHVSASIVVIMVRVLTKEKHIHVLVIQGIILIMLITILVWKMSVNVQMEPYHPQHVRKMVPRIVVIVTLDII
jgi:uncharacterized integral membrane protein